MLVRPKQTSEYRKVYQYIQLNSCKSKIYVVKNRRNLYVKLLGLDFTFLLNLPAPVLVPTVVTVNASNFDFGL
jgi:hypothetical protein